MLSKSNKKILILIPALNPPKEFVGYVDKLIENNFKNILVINDGSTKEYDEIFEKISTKDECSIIKHDINKGKGKSLKDGLEYFKKMEDFEEYEGVITVDCDGQHLIKDIKSVMEKMIENPSSLVLGARNFNLENVPAKSSFGNKVTSGVFKVLYGAKISDTQTGLRGIPNSLVESFINISGDRYEYETNMLIDCILKKVDFIEVPIETVYIDNNSESHFRPIHDSISIYLRILNSFVKYSAVSIISAVIDILMFKVFLSFIKLNLEETILIMISTILARIISSFINFTLNKNITFKSKKRISNTIVKYYILCIIQMMLSGLLVSGIHYFTNFSEVAIKIIVDTIIFIINYRIQRLIIFNK